MSQKGFASIIILIVIIVVLAGMGGYFVMNRQAPTPTPTPTPTPITVSATATPISKIPTPTPQPPKTTPTIPSANIKNARTLYEGYVGIEPILLSEIKIKLEAQGCHINDYKGERTNRCAYRETKVTQLEENGIEIYPYGLGFGLVSFYITENKLWADKDIPGSPNPNNFKEAVRQDVNSLGNLVQFKENSWKITRTKYPWTVIY